MKFWEALREMERGAVCEGGDQIYRMHNGELQRFQALSNSWSRCAELGVCLMQYCKWSIHTPAPNIEPLGKSVMKWLDAFALMNDGKVLEANYGHGWIKHRVMAGVLQESYDGGNWSFVQDRPIGPLMDADWRLPVRETFGFAEAWKRSKTCRVTRDDKPKSLADHIGVDCDREAAWLNVSDGYVYHLRGSDIDATDWYELDAD